MTMQKIRFLNSRSSFCVVIKHNDYHFILSAVINLPDYDIKTNEGIRPIKKLPPERESELQLSVYPHV